MQQINQFSHQIDKERNILKRQIINNFLWQEGIVANGLRLQIPTPIEIALPSLWIVNLYYSYTEEWPCLYLFGTYPIFLSNFWVPQIYGTGSRYLLFCTRCGLICSIRIFLCHNICRTSFRKRIIYSALMYYFYSFFVFYQFYFMLNANIVKII